MKPLAILLLSIFIFSIITAYVIHYSSLVSAFDPCPSCGEREPKGYPESTTTTTTIPPYCGDGIINNGEICELPSTTNNAYCSQTTSDCQGNKTGSRDAFGNCNSACQCAQDPFNYVCVKDSCNAECAANSDCPNKCVGDTRYFGGTCNGNSCYCNYQSENCGGDGWYDTSSFACDGSCRRCKAQEYRNYRCAPEGCTYDVTDTRQLCGNAPSGQHCVDGSFTSTGYCDSSNPYCGNACSVKTDRYECNGNNQCTHLDYTDTSFCPVDTSCSGGSCSSEVSCGSGTSTCVDACNKAGQLLRCNGLGSCSNFWKFTDAISCNPYTCSSGSCTSVCDKDCGAVCESGNQETRTVSCTTSQNCPGTKQQKRVCQTSICDWGTWQDTTSCQDIPNDNCPAQCGDGIIQPPEVCDPATYNSFQCPQTTFTCFGSKTGSRDAYGDCTNGCQCQENNFVYSCVKGSCGAECAGNSDCSNKCIGTIRYYSGTCPSSTCACNYITQDCSKLSGCTNTTQKQWVACPDDSCKLCEQVKKECYEGLCTVGSCEKSLVSQSWEFTGRRQAKSCPYGTYCSSDSGQCIPKVCQGQIQFEGSVQACPTRQFNLAAHITPFTSFCDNRRVYFRVGDCSGKTITTCNLRSGQCISMLQAVLNNLGTTTVVACVDLNGDGNFNGLGEQDALNVNVNCNNCPITWCSTLAGCSRCNKCGSTLNYGVTNIYGQNMCLNPDQQCLYGCIVGSCGANHCASANS